MCFMLEALAVFILCDNLRYTNTIHYSYGISYITVMLYNFLQINYSYLNKNIYHLLIIIKSIITNVTYFS